MGEWPLIIFTVLSQLVAGAICTLWLLETLGKSLAPEEGKPLVASLILILGGGLLFSLLHLGHPFLAIRALTNMGSSWLSREVVLFSILLVLLVIYYLKWSKSNGKERKTIGSIVALVAILAVLASAMVYSVPARPAWSSLYPTFSFFMTTVLLGPLYVGAFLSWKGKTSIQVASLIGTLALVSCLGFALYISSLLGGTPENHQTSLNLLGSASFWARAIVGWLLPIIMLLVPHFRKTKISQSTLITVFTLVLLGEILGRELFYSATVALQVAGL